MAFAARAGDPTGHPGVISGLGILTVLIGGQPAAVMGEKHTCSFPPPTGPHPPSMIASGSLTVLIGGKPAARVGDKSACGAPIMSGMPTVDIGG